jgi:C1A family cysteine protease
MKLSISTYLVLSSLAVAASADPSARFLADKATLLQELRAWKQSDAGQYAKQHGFIITPKLGLLSDAEIEQDQLHRLFQTKLHIDELQRENPDAQFSIDSPFTLMTDQEFEAYVRKSSCPNMPFRGVTVSSAASANSTVGLEAEDKDWTTSGCVAPIKNQGQCGSCWAFAATAVLESAYCLKQERKALTTFSEQQLTSCDTVSHGCEGGYPGDGLAFIQKNGGVCGDRDYPYSSGESGQSGDCQSECVAIDVRIQHVVSVPESEAGLVAAVSKTPVAVGVAAGNRTWKQYKGGVVSTCASADLDHAVVVVGYSGSFYKIKNSWGTAWGESGFIRLKRGVAGAGTCGIIGPKSVYPVL